MATKPRKKAATAPAARGTAPSAGASGGGLAASPAEDSFVPTTTDMGTARWIEVDGIRTRYFEQGTGEPIVLVHGAQAGADFGASSAETWNLNVGPLSRHHRTIAFDRLGQGHTDNPKTDRGYTMHASVQHTIGVLDALGQKPYHLVGHSRGGYVVTRVAMERPDLVKSCVPVSSGTLAPGPTRNHVIHRDPPAQGITREVIRWYAEKYSWNQKLPTPEWLDGCLAIAEMEKSRIAVDRMIKRGLLQTQYVPDLARQKTEVHRWLLETGMPCPTLVVWGYNDPGADFEVGLQLIEMYMAKQRRTELRVFNQCGHFVMREHPAAFNRMLDTWIRQNS